MSKNTPIYVEKDGPTYEEQLRHILDRYSIEMVQHYRWLLSDAGKELPASQLAKLNTSLAHLKIVIELSNEMFTMVREEHDSSFNAEENETFEELMAYREHKARRKDK